MAYFIFISLSPPCCNERQFSLAECCHFAEEKFPVLARDWCVLFFIFYPIHDQKLLGLWQQWQRRAWLCHPLVPLPWAWVGCSALNEYDLGQTL